MEPTNLVVLDGAVVAGFFGAIHIANAQIFDCLNWQWMREQVDDQDFSIFFLIDARHARSS